MTKKYLSTGLRGLMVSALLIPYAHASDAASSSKTRWMIDTKSAVSPVSSPTVEPSYQPAAAPTMGSTAGFVKVSAPSSNESIVVHGAGIEQEAPKNPIYHVSQGDTVYSISKKFGLRPEQLMEINGIKNPSSLKIGQTLLVTPTPMGINASTGAISHTDVGGGSQDAGKKSLGVEPLNQKTISPAPTENSVLAVPTTSSAAFSGHHRVVKGDTVFSLSRTYGVSQERLMQDNALKSPAALRTGMMLIVPTLASPTTVVSVELSAAAAPASTELPPPFQPPTPAEDDIRLSSTTTKTIPNPVAEGFIWPLRGRILVSYGVNEIGERSDGINISAPTGTPVKVVENGVVIYSGDALSLFGNLILVQHPNGYISAYAHLASSLVQKGQSVKRGDVIARVGKTGFVSTSQLHFELRRHKRPVNPLDFLPTLPAEKP